MTLFTFLFLYAVQGIIFGIAVNSVINNKGYDDNWFWWGFFFGFVALMVALSKPEVTRPSYSQSILMQKARQDNILNNGGWTCSYCNTINANYVTSCSCGRNHEDTERRLKLQQKKQLEKAQASDLAQDEAKKIELIGQYKKLLDSGAITQEEFEAKKKNLLFPAE